MNACVTVPLSKTSPRRIHGRCALRRLRVMPFTHMREDPERSDVVDAMAAQELPRREVAGDVAQAAAHAQPREPDLGEGGARAPAAMVASAQPGSLALLSRSTAGGEEKPALSRTATAPASECSGPCVGAVASDARQRIADLFAAQG